MRAKAMVNVVSPARRQQESTDRLGWPWLISQWLLWLMIVALWSYCLFYHLAVLKLFNSASLEWWPYVVSALGLLAYAGSLLPADSRSFLFVLTGLLFAGAAGAFLIGAPLRPGPPWYLFEVPFVQKLGGQLHDRYFGDDQGLSLFGLYGLGPLLICVVLTWRAVKLSRRHSPWPRRSLCALAAAAFFTLAVQMADRIASAWLMARYVEYLISREPAPLVGAVRMLLRHPLCRTSCTRRICQVDWVPSETDQSLLSDFLEIHQPPVCRDLR